MTALRPLIVAEIGMAEQRRVLLITRRPLQFHLLEQNRRRYDACWRWKIAAGEAIDDETVAAHGFNLAQRANRNTLGERSTNQLFMAIGDINLVRQNRHPNRASPICVQNFDENSVLEILLDAHLDQFLFQILVSLAVVRLDEEIS